MLFDEFIVAVDVIRMGEVPGHQNTYVTAFGGSGTLAANSSDAALSEDLAAQHMMLCDDQFLKNNSVAEHLDSAHTFNARQASPQALPNLDNRLVNLSYLVSSIKTPKTM
jgi:hypothetical protein